MKVLIALNLLTVALGGFLARNKNFSFSNDLLTRRRKSSAKVLRKEAKAKVDTEETNELEAALQALYEGVDFDDEQLRLEDFNDAEPEHVERNVQVLGLQNSGTSMLKAFLYANFGRRLNYFSDAVLTNQEPNKRMGVNDHANLKELFKQDNRTLKKLDDSLVFTISVIRNPYSWLSSMRQYGTSSAEPFAECLEGEDWLTRPCLHLTPGGPKESRVKEVPYQSLAGMWGHWAEGYIKAGEYGVQRNILVTYENLISDPCGVMARIAEVMKIKQPECVFPFDSGASNVRENQKRRVELDYFTMKAEEKRETCSHLDADVLDYMHYPRYNCTELLNEDEKNGLQGALVRQLHQLEHSLQAKKTKKHKKQAIDLMRLYEGRDFAEGALTLEDISDDGEDINAERNVQIVGLEHSGTDLLRSILYANFGRRLNYYSDKATDIASNQRLGIWPHANLQEVSRADPSAARIYHDQEVYIVSVVRNPYAWLQVMRKEWAAGDDRVMDQALVGCVRGAEWLSQNCTHPYPGGRMSGAEEKSYGSLAGVWGKWTESYLRSADAGFHRNLLITYESLTSDASMSKVLDRLANYMQIEQPAGGWVYPLDSADSKERKLADREARDQDIFMNQYNQQDKQRACMNLDQDVVKYMQYPVLNCTGGPTPEAAEAEAPAAGDSEIADAENQTATDSAAESADASDVADADEMEVPAADDAEAAEPEGQTAADSEVAEPEGTSDAGGGDEIEVSETQ